MDGIFASLNVEHAIKRLMTDALEAHAEQEPNSISLQGLEVHLPV